MVYTEQINTSTMAHSNVCSYTMISFCGNIVRKTIKLNNVSRNAVHTDKHFEYHYSAFSCQEIYTVQNVKCCLTFNPGIWNFFHTEIVTTSFTGNAVTVHLTQKNLR